jgi:hypothetical protein
MNSMNPPPATPSEPSPPPRWLDLTTQALLEDCRFEAIRGSGPGGQKRNKTSNAIRLTHLPTAIHVFAEESRSQSENKHRAIRRLKLRLATDIRHAIDSRLFEPPDWFGQVVQLGRLAISHHNEHYPRTAALVLDLLAARSGSVGDVAKLLGVSTSSVVKFLEEEPQLWTAANGIRKMNGKGQLETRRKQIRKGQREAETHSILRIPPIAEGGSPGLFSLTAAQRIRGFRPRLSGTTCGATNI